MSHPEQLAYFAACLAANEGMIPSSRVLEIGSYDVNGSMRRLFRGAELYKGVDLTPGPGVDEVTDGGNITDPDGSWDVTLSGECFEHDPAWRDTLANMARLTRAGGLVAFTCASRGRVEHGTRRTSAAESPGTQAIGVDYYRNVSAAEVRSLPLEQWFSSWHLHYAPIAGDLYFAGVRRGRARPGDVVASLPSASRVKRISRNMPPGDRAVRVPLLLLAHLIRDEDTFQRVAVPYWRVALPAVRSLGHMGASVRRRHGSGKVSSPS